MRGRVSQELRKTFLAEFEQRFPEFRRERVGKWVLGVGKCLSFFLRLQALQRHDQFVIEVGWTTGDPIEPRDNYQDVVDLTAPRWGARLTQLMGALGLDEGEQSFAVVPRPTVAEKEAWLAAFDRGEVDSLSPPDPPAEDVLPRVGPLVREAIDLFEAHAIPLFRRVATQRGFAWPIR